MVRHSLLSSKNSGLGFPGIAAYLHNETPGPERRYLGSPPGGRIYDTVLDVDGKQDGGGVARADYRPRGRQPGPSSGRGPERIPSRQPELGGSGTDPISAPRKD
jgi:hypothetical protein